MTAPSAAGTPPKSHANREILGMRITEEIGQ
jgi:hypothetical protein